MIQVKWPLAALAVLTPVALIGCGGGNNGNPSPKATTSSATPVPTAAPDSNNSDIATTTFVALQQGGTSVTTFRGDTPGSSNTRQISGLPGGVSLRGIDARVAPSLNTSSTGAGSGSNGVVAVYGLGTNDQLYTLDFAGNGNVTATPVGTPATFTGFTLRQGAYGFDFNPAADRLRVVSGTQNGRINPNNGAAVDGDSNTAGTQGDGTLRYSSGDANAGSTPNITAAGYTNNDANTATGTVNYGIDSARGLLVTQGTPDTANTADDDSDGQPDGAVSPNTGLLFTIGSLGNAFSGSRDVGLEVFGPANTAVAVAGNNFYRVDLGSGAATNLGRIGSSSNVIDITVLR